MKKNAEKCFWWNNFENFNFFQRFFLIQVRFSEKEQISIIITIIIYSIILYTLYSSFINVEPS
jgi:hypothetical protein